MYDKRSQLAKSPSILRAFWTVSRKFSLELVEKGSLWQALVMFIKRVAAADESVSRSCGAITKRSAD
jgi:hypothetical protein